MMNYCLRIVPVIHNSTETYQGFSREKCNQKSQAFSLGGNQMRIQSKLVYYFSHSDLMDKELISPRLYRKRRTARACIQSIATMTNYMLVLAFSKEISIVWVYYIFRSWRHERYLFEVSSTKPNLKFLRLYAIRDRIRERIWFAGLNNTRTAWPIFKWTVHNHNYSFLFNLLFVLRRCRRVAVL